jgi:hypothetical protein
MEQFREKMQQPRQDGTPCRQREGKQKVAPVEKDEEMEFQNAKRVLKAVYGHSDFESSDKEHHKALHIMFGVHGTSRPGASSRHCAERLR